MADSKIFKDILIENIGYRVKDGRCVFCSEKLIPGEYCTCKNAEKINKYFKKINNHLEKVETFNNFFEDKQILCELKKNANTPDLFNGYDLYFYEIENESQKKGFDIVSDYYKNAVKNFLFGTNLIILGNYGTGKTALISVLCNLLTEEFFFDCRFVNIVDLFDIVKASFSSLSIDTLKLIEIYKKADFLFLDDIDKKTPTSYAKELVYSIVNSRVENELPTIITANHDLEDLDKNFYGEATISRLVHKSKIVLFTHKNKRFI